MYNFLNKKNKILIFIAIILYINSIFIIYAQVYEDDDNDGIDNSVDKCPSTPGGCSVYDATDERAGCPKDPVDIIIQNDYGRACKGADILVRLVNKNNCLTTKQVDYETGETTLGEWERLTVKLLINGNVGNDACTPEGDPFYVIPGEGVYCPFKIDVDPSNYDLKAEYSIRYTYGPTINYEEIFKEGFIVEEICRTNVACGHGTHVASTPTHGLEFISTKEQPHFVLEGSRYFIYGGTTLKIKDISTFSQQSSDGWVGPVDKPIGILAWITKNDITLNNLANSRNTEGFFKGLPPTRKQIFESTEGFLWTADLPHGAFSGNSNSFNVDYNFPVEGDFDFNTDYFNSICDSPNDYVCPVASGLCAIGTLVGDHQGMVPLKEGIIRVVIPKVAIKPEYNFGNKILVRLYEAGRNITIPFNITNTGKNKTKVKVSMDCDQLNCFSILADELIIDPNKSASFLFAMTLSNLTDGPFNYAEMPLILNHTLTPKIYIGTSYPGLGLYENISGEINITLVDQDWSDDFCRTPNNIVTGILEEGKGNLPWFNWLVRKEDGYFSADDPYKTCCGDDLNQDNWDNPLYHGYNASCYNGITLLSCDLSQENKSIVNENGTLFLCGNEQDSTNQIGYCNFKCHNTLFCAYDNNEWKLTNNRNINTSKSWINLTINQPIECCEPDQCWNGNSCIENQYGDPIGQIYSGYRCINGEWQEADQLCAIDDSDTCGYCPNPGQCLVNLQGNPEDNNNPEGDPQCIATGQYIKDDYCDENGIWTSRTKLIALQLRDLPQNDYTLFCGNHQDVLNYLDYVVQGNKNARAYVTEETNNYCILIYDNKIVFGTSLNQEINEGNYKFMDVVGASCNNAMSNDGKYNQCSTNNVWYNKKFKSIIYSNSSIQLTQINLLERFEVFLKTPFSALINKLKETITPPYDQSFVRGVKKFKNLYINKQNNKFILGTIEGGQFKNLVIEYKNFNTGICEIINTYNETLNCKGNCGIVCSKEGNNYYILAQGSTFTNLDPANIWAGLTGKLRIG